MVLPYWNFLFATPPKGVAVHSDHIYEAEHSNFFIQNLLFTCESIEDLDKR